MCGLLLCCFLYLFDFLLSCFFLLSCLILLDSFCLLCCLFLLDSFCLLSCLFLLRLVLLKLSLLHNCTAAICFLGRIRLSAP